jgi:hypothetical protein
MTDHKPVSAAELTKEVQAAVKKLAIPNLPTEPTIIAHPPFIWGFILRNFGQPVESAAGISARLAAELPPAKGATPVTLITGGAAGGAASEAAAGPHRIVICGYIRDPNLLK